MNPTAVYREVPEKMEDRLIVALDIPEAAPGGADAATRLELLPLKNAKVADVVPAGRNCLRPPTEAT